MHRYQSLETTSRQGSSVTPESCHRLERLLHQVLELPPTQRDVSLDPSRGDDPVFREEAESPIKADGRDGRLKAQPLLAARSKPDARQCQGSLAELSTAKEPLVEMSDRAGGTPPGRRSPSLYGIDDRRFCPGTIVANRYRIVTLRDRGGVGEIYLAEDLKLGLLVALKFLPQAMQRDEARLSRLLGEVKIARKISHPNVCRVYDIGEAQGYPFISMEYIDGENLASLRRRIGRLPKAKALEIGRQLCSGLSAAHEQGILHRDLKPANLMIDGHGRARITDFGMAVLAESLTGREARGGTPGYMAPEQLAGQEVSVRSDLYALGLVLYELFTGERVFQARSIAGLIDLQRQAAPIPPSNLVQGLDPEIEDMILRCLETDPRDRPASAEAVASGLAIRGGNRAWRPTPGLTIPHRSSWVLERKLGEGDFGEVWLASLRETRDLRVFKFCHDLKRLRTLQREITIFRLLKEVLGDRGDIVRILDWNFEQPPYFVESEYTEDGNLVEWAEQQGGLDAVPLAVRLEIVAQVATALAAAHSVGVLHKDLKPANVLITTDSKGRVRAQLTDFGLGAVIDCERLAKAEITAAGLAMTAEEIWLAIEETRSSTRLYLAPELLEGKPATVQADVYALGVILYQMVVADFSRALASGWRRDIEREVLSEDIAIAVDGSPDERLGNALRLAERLRSLESRCEERLVERREKEASERLLKRVEQSRRRRRLVTAGITILVLFAGAMAIMAHRVSREAQRAKQEVQRANREAEAAQHISEFMVGLFEGADPFGNSDPRGATVTMREALDRGVERLELDLREQPEIQARLMNVIGGVYSSLGLLDSAEALIELALERRRQIHGKEHTEVANSLNTLAKLLRYKGDYEAAEPLLRRALEMRRKLLGEEHAQVAESLHELATLLDRKGDYEIAESFFLQAIDMQRRLLGEEHLVVASSLNNLAVLKGKAGDYEAAEPLFRQALEIQQKLLGKEHPRIATNLDNLAVLLKSKGDFEGAGPLYREALEMRRQLLGEEHFLVAISLNNLAKFLKVTGDYEAAELLYRQSLAMFRKLLGEEHPNVATSLSNLAALRVASGSHVEAEELVREALKIFRKKLPAGHWRTANAESVLGACLAGLGYYDDAEHLLLESYSSVKNKTRYDSAYTRDILKHLVTLYETWQKPGEAAKYRTLWLEASGLTKGESNDS